MKERRKKCNSEKKKKRQGQEIESVVFVRSLDSFDLIVLDLLRGEGGVQRLDDSGTRLRVTFTADSSHHQNK